MFSDTMETSLKKYTSDHIDVELMCKLEQRKQAEDKGESQNFEYDHVAEDAMRSKHARLDVELRLKLKQIHQAKAVGETKQFEELNLSLSSTEIIITSDDGAAPQNDAAVDNRSSPVTVTKFDSFYLSLRDTEKERRNRCSDSLRRLRQYRGLTYVEETTRQSIINDDEEVDDDVLHIGGFELQGESSSHEVVQHAYGATKEVWEWGKTFPVLSNILGVTEGVTNKFLEITIHHDVHDFEKDLVIPNLKKLDDEILSPMISTILNMLGPAVSAGEEVIGKPVMHIVPYIPFFGKLVLGEDKEDEAKHAIDHRTDGCLSTK